MKEHTNKKYIIKPGSFTQIYLQLIISIKYRECKLSGSFRPRLFQIMGGILNEYGHKPIIINGVEDHVHLFFRFNPKISLSDTVKELKRRTTVFINNEGYHAKRFRWQYGYGAFSYSQTQIERVYKYIARQEEHHKTMGFKKEYRIFLDKFKVEYQENYLP